jgi:multidrug efflux pump subunit AcrA (membrane-fusion protein)
MNQPLEQSRRKALAAGAVGILALGAVGFAALVYTHPVAAERSNVERVLEVAAVAIEPAEQSPAVLGHGTVRARHQVSIVPQVSGRLTHVHPDLAQGKIIPRGELLFEIDPEVYQARVNQAEAETRALEASLGRHDEELSNLEARIANAQAMLDIDQDDYNTVKRLYEVEKVGTQRDVDLTQQKLLRSKGAMVELTSHRSMVPHLRRETEAQLEASRARLTMAKHDLENTKIRCPFEARVETVTAYTSQVVTAPFAIATLTDMEAFEISVGVDPRELRWLNAAVRPESLSGAVAPDAPTVKVRWAGQGREFVWTGRVSRFERVDEATRTARMVVEVQKMDMIASSDGAGDDPAPTLSIGMYCTTELPGRTLSDALLVPRHAIYDNRYVYVLEPDPASPNGATGRLARREVPMLRTVEGKVLVDYRTREDNKPCELKPGERVVVSPLTKPVVGMKVRLREQVTVLPIELRFAA